MKPLVLQMQAFGPFAGQQVIDFRELGNKTFFLIHGPTGSGKTSILDGICFALFGDSSGGERDGRQLRSHHADPATLTELSFSFALGESTYRVRRVPEQMRKARRGGGETRQLPVAELSRIESVDGEPTERAMASGWSKVTDAVQQLLGFESQQFRQVIMLPQGRFFEFLKSGSQEREKILQALFGTALYKRIEEQLKQAANESERQAEKLRTQRQAHLDQARVDNEAALAERQAQQAQALAACEAAETAAAATALTAEQLLAQARSLAERFAELDQSAAGLQVLREQEAPWAGRRLRLADARRAAAIEPHAAALDEKDRLLAEEQRRAQSLAALGASAEKEDAQAQAVWGRERARGPEAEQLIARIAMLDALAQKVSALASTRVQHQSASEAAMKSAALLQSATQARQCAAQALKAFEAHVQQWQVQAAGIEGLRVQHAQLAAQRSQAEALTARLAERERAGQAAELTQSRWQAAERQCTAARGQRDALRQQWLSGQAARLAHELVPGQPCPVCGAHDHPAPAHAVGNWVSDPALRAQEDQLAAAEAALLATAQQQAQARQAVGVLDAVIAELRRAPGETPGELAGAAPTDTDPIKAEAQAVQARLTQAESAARELQAALARHTALQDALNKAEAGWLQADAAARQAADRLQQLQALRDEREAGVPAELSQPAALTAVRAAAVQSLDALRRALDAANDGATRAGQRRVEAQTRLQASQAAAQALTQQRAEHAAGLAERVRTAGFGDLEVFRKACLGAPEMLALEQGAEAFRAALDAAVARQQRADEATRDMPRPDLGARQTQHEAAQLARQAAARATSEARAALAVSVDFITTLTRLAAQYAEVEQRHAVLRQVADVASGVNPQRMSFQRYVLATLLEEVLVATTQRLTLMSRGRYEIRRRLQATDQRSAAGLDLEVHDQYTGSTRAVQTLSGGESFLASLALALGLSDVVMAHAGGIRLDAIFVDEGFGTLDPEALDVAVRALHDLQQAGRMVGIISHVAELKEWIAARLELTATRSGSLAVFRL